MNDATYLARIIELEAQLDVEQRKNALAQQHLLASGEREQAYEKMLGQDGFAIARDYRASGEREAKLREALQKLAILHHVRLAEGGGTVPSGFSCFMCRAEWNVGEKEHHRSGCALAGDAP